jgi:adenosylhomocysteinase
MTSSGSSVTKGESLVDTLYTLQALGADAVVIRHSYSGAPYLAARHIKGSVINAGDGWHGHPTQGLLDAYTIRSKMGDIAGRKVVVAGYGWVGKGITSRMAGHGAHVTVVEVDPVRALEALMDGFSVMTVGQAAAWGELFITATGNINVFRREHFEAMGDGAIMANSGHFDAELDLAALRAMAEGHVREVRENVQEFDLGG